MKPSAEPTISTRLTAFAMFRFIFSWIAIGLVAISPLSLLQGEAPISMDLTNPVLVTFGVFFLANWIWLCFNYPKVWKIDVYSEGVVLRKFFANHFVSWSNLQDVVYKRLGSDTIYVIRLRDGRSLSILSGFARQEEILSLIRQHVPKRFLVTEKECHQDALSAFHQWFFLLWSIGAIIGGGLLIISHWNAWSESFNFRIGILFLALGAFIATTTLARAKSVRVVDDGLIVSTLRSQFPVPWKDITSIKYLPLVNMLVVKTRRTLFMLGEEMSFFDELKQLITDNVPR